MTDLIFLDTETTSLDDRTGEVWEVGLIKRSIHPVEVKGETIYPGQQSMDIEYLWQLPVENLDRADPISLRICKFYDRRWPASNANCDLEKNLQGMVLTNHDESPEWRVALNGVFMEEWAKEFVKLTRGAHLIGNVVSFDEERLRKLIRRWGYTPMWHYHLVDVESLAAGFLGLNPPWKSNEISEALGVPVPEDQHGALPDARWARDMYDAVLRDQAKQL